MTLRTRLLTLATTVAIAVGVVAVVALPGGAAGAATGTCTAWGTLPARVALDGHTRSVRMTLHGSSACSAGSFDNGATATLRGPGTSDPQRWTHFGDTETESFAASLNKIGTYGLRHGDVQVYDSRDERVPSRWRVTSTVVKRAARFRHLDRAANTITAQAQRYGDTGWTAQGGVRVVLQRRTWSGWTSVAQENATNTGRVLFHGARTGQRYRLVGAGTSAVWGSTSRTI